MPAATPIPPDTEECNGKSVRVSLTLLIDYEQVSDSANFSK